MTIDTTINYDLVQAIFNYPWPMSQIRGAATEDDQAKEWCAWSRKPISTAITYVLQSSYWAWNDILDGCNQVKWSRNPGMSSAGEWMTIEIWLMGMSCIYQGQSLKDYVDQEGMMLIVVITASRPGKWYISWWWNGITDANDTQGGAR